MGLVNIPEVSNGNPVDKELFNSRFAPIVAALNGNIDAANIKDASVTYAKMALIDGDIPSSKMSLVVQNAANNVGQIQIGELLVQWGVNSLAAGGTLVTFVRSYAVNPSVILTLQDPNNHGAWLTAVTNSSFTGKQAYTGGPLPVRWIAIGKAA